MAYGPLNLSQLPEGVASSPELMVNIWTLNRGLALLLLALSCRVLLSLSCHATVAVVGLHDLSSYPSCIGYPFSAATTICVSSRLFANLTQSGQGSVGLALPSHPTIVVRRRSFYPPPLGLSTAGRCLCLWLLARGLDTLPRLPFQPSAFHLPSCFMGSSLV